MNFERQDFAPDKVLKVYKQIFKNNYYIEIHNVTKKMQSDSEFELGPGRTLTKRTFQKLLGAAYSNEISTYFEGMLMDPRLLACEPVKHKRYIIWYDPVQVREINFTENNILKSGMYSLPALLYFVMGDTIRVFAMKTGKRRPAIDTKLYHAPIMNRVSDYQLCWGSVKCEVAHIDEIDAEMKAWENFLWNSRFSHTGGAAASKTSMTKIYQSTFEGRKAFPIAELRDTKLTIIDLFKNYLQ